MSSETATPPVSSPWWRRRRVVGVAVVVVVVAGSILGVVLVSGSDGDRTTAPYGAQFAAENPSSTLGGRTVQLPGGPMAFVFDRTPDTGPEDDRGRAVPAPDKGRFVLLRWRGPARVARVFAAGATVHPVTITLATAGRRFPLLVRVPTAYQPVPSGAAWVAVPGDASDARVDVGYDGVVQRLDPATGSVAKGRAASLYNDRVDTVDCDVRATGGRRVSGRSVPECTVTARRTGYVEGRDGPRRGAPGWSCRPD